MPFGFIDGYKIEKVIQKSCFNKGITNINQIKFPISIQAVDIKDGTLVRFISQSLKRGFVDEKIKYIEDCDISKAVRASISYPIIFNFCNVNNDYLIDGGVRDNIPVDVLKNMGASKTIASYFEEEKSNHIPNDLVEVATKCVSIMNYHISNEDLKIADYAIKIKFNEIKLLDVSKIDFCYEVGYKKGLEFVNKLNKK